MKTKQVIRHIVHWLRDYAEKSRTNGFVVGISGGIDSAVTSALSAKTDQPTLCVEMPIHQHQDQVSRARRHIESLELTHPNVRSVEVQLSRFFDEFVRCLPPVENEEQRAMALANTRARLRMTTLYYFASLHRYLVMGTGNKVEDFGVGFFTKYGDGGVDLSPIADLTKTEVYELGDELGLINEIIKAPPTDGLWGDNRTDEDQIGASYPELEWAMGYSGKPNDKTTLTERQKQVLEIYKKLHAVNKHKMEPIPVCKIPDELKN
ncbi:MAG: NAD(+) synthase [Gammaproteobacteria bacterium]|nr:NAD(+) synthase [Gammaproteobacteria bacterium]